VAKSSLAPVCVRQSVWIDPFGPFRLATDPEHQGDVQSGFKKLRFCVIDNSDRDAVTKM